MLFSTSNSRDPVVNQRKNKLKSLKDIKNTFKDYFKNQEIELPERLEQYEIIIKAGWRITYLMEEKSESKTVVHIISSTQNDKYQKFHYKTKW